MDKTNKDMHESEAILRWLKYPNKKESESGLVRERDNETCSTELLSG